MESTLWMRASNWLVAGVTFCFASTVASAGEPIRLVFPPQIIRVQLFDPKRPPVISGGFFDEPPFDIGFCGVGYRDAERELEDIRKRLRTTFERANHRRFHGEPSHVSTIAP